MCRTQGTAMTPIDVLKKNYVCKLVVKRMYSKVDPVLSSVQNKDPSYLCVQQILINMEK